MPLPAQVLLGVPPLVLALALCKARPPWRLPQPQQQLLALRSNLSNDCRERHPTTIVNTLIATDLTTVVVPKTVTTILPTAVIVDCAEPYLTFFLQASVGGESGQCAYVPPYDDDFGNQIISFDSSTSAASLFYLSDSNLYTGNSLGSIDTVYAEPLYFDTMAQLAGSDEAYLICSLQAPATGTLSSTAGSDVDSVPQISPAGSSSLVDGEFVTGIKKLPPFCCGRRGVRLSATRPCQRILPLGRQRHHARGLWI
ncbi:hypothetical protein MMC18_005752 [Xylographa bjoerkii]|nr:hypothetical protein [Xylographa bjoerkii]